MTTTQHLKAFNAWFNQQPPQSYNGSFTATQIREIAYIAWLASCAAADAVAEHNADLQDASHCEAAEAAFGPLGQD